jgi:SagB-type dehydrogenase family enzyme
VRSFLSAPVSLQDLAGIVRGTWGRTGWLDAGALGRFALKTSPSGGSLHPIECYVLAWNVRGLESGLYHYDVLADALRRLRAGDFRNDAVRAASGQRWVGRAAFLCVMTAVFERTLWKYQQENAYRVLWLDAGHLAQTFCLLASARGLGPFTTAAIQDSYIEKLIGLDGIREFPVYLCGAGIPEKRASGKGLPPG